MSTIPSSTMRREIREVVREEPLMHAPILAALQSGPRTVPEIAAAIGYPEQEVMVWVMGMRRYGVVEVVAGATDEGYFRYQAARG